VAPNLRHQREPIGQFRDMRLFVQMDQRIILAQRTQLPENDDVARELSASSVALPVRQSPAADCRLLVGCRTVKRAL
jgi:hypothetical protein